MAPKAPLHTAASGRSQRTAAGPSTQPPSSLRTEGIQNTPGETSANTPTHQEAYVAPAMPKGKGVRNTSSSGSCRSNHSNHSNQS